MTVKAYPVFMFNDVLPIINDNFEEKQSDALIKVFYKMEEMFQTYNEANNEKHDTIMTIINDHTIKHNELKTEIKKDLLLELATKADIMELKGKIDANEQKLTGNMASLEKELKGNMASLEKELKGNMASLEKELKGMINTLENKTKADNNKLSGDIKSLEKELKGDIKSLENELKGEIKSIRVWMKLLVGVALVGMTFFSPLSVELIKLLK